jgi:hypothetical protein
MPKSRIPKERLFRDFAKQDRIYVKKNYLKNLKVIKNQYAKKLGMDFSKLSKDFETSKSNIGKRYVWPLVKAGYIYKHFDKLTPSDTYEDHLFRDETKYNYRVRYAITQKARLLVQRFYNDLEK